MTQRNETLAEIAERQAFAESAEGQALAQRIATERRLRTESRYRDGYDSIADGFASDRYAQHVQNRRDVARYGRPER